MIRTLSMLVLAICASLFLGPAGAGLIFPTAESSASIEGKVVDAATNKPLAGVLVIATWRDFTPDYLAHETESGPQYTCYQLVNVLTTLSGTDGSYEFPGWKGKLGHCRSMFTRQPGMVWYKPGYKPVHTADLLTTGAYDAGPDYTDPHPTTVALQPLGAHYFDSGDNYVESVREYAGWLNYLFGQDKKGPCFWKEETPALLMLFQEQRRLSAYTDQSSVPADSDFQNLDCGNDDALTKLEQQAIATVPEVPTLPYVYFALTHTPGVNAEASAMPKELLAHVQQQRMDGHAAADKGTVYYVYLNPINPYYLAVLNKSVGKGGEQAQSLDVTDNATTRWKDGIYGFDCVAVPPSSAADALQRNESGPYCTWTVALFPTYLPFGSVAFAAGGKPDVYDAKNGLWTLTERSLVRPQQEVSPAYLELIIPSSLGVATTLAKVGPDRWQLPPPGQSFTVTVTSN